MSGRRGGRGERHESASGGNRVGETAERTFCRLNKRAALLDAGTTTCRSAWPAGARPPRSTTSRRRGAGASGSGRARASAWTARIGVFARTSALSRCRVDARLYLSGRSNRNRAHAFETCNAPMFPSTTRRRHTTPLLPAPALLASSAGTLISSSPRSSRRRGGRPRSLREPRREGPPQRRRHGAAV